MKKYIVLPLLYAFILGFGILIGILYKNFFLYISIFLFLISMLLYFKQKFFIILILLFCLGLYKGYLIQDIPMPQGLKTANIQVLSTNSYFEKYTIYGKIKNSNSFVYIYNLDSIYYPQSEIKIKGDFIKMKNKLPVINNYYIDKIEDIQTVLKPNIFFEYITNMRFYIKSHIDKIFPYPESSIINGIILGEKKELDKNIKNNFSKSGISHILAISGMHITIIFLFFIFLLNSLGKWSKIFMSLFFIFLYIIFIGATPSSIRAGIMLSILSFSYIFGKMKYTLSAWCIAFIIMVIFNTLYIFDIGFLLSFSATLGIILYNDLFLENLNKFKNNKIIYYILNLFFISLFAQIFTLPIILYIFENLNPLAVFLNVIIIPFLPALILFSILSIVLYTVSFNLSIIFLFIPIFILRLIIYFTNFISLFSITINTNLFIMLCIYIFLFIIIFLLYFYINKKLLFTKKNNKC